MVVTDADRKINELFKHIKETLSVAIKDPANKLTKEIVLRELREKGKYPHEIAADHNKNLNDNINDLSDSDKKSLSEAYKNRPTEDYLPDNIAQQIDSNPELKNNIKEAQKKAHREENREDQIEEDEEEGENDEREDDEDQEDENENEYENEDEDQDEDQEETEENDEEQGEEGEEQGESDNGTGENGPNPESGVEDLAEDEVSNLTKKVAEEAVKDAATDAVAGAAATGAAPAAVPTIIVVIVVIVVVIIIMIIMAGCSSGRKGNVQASATENAADFAVVSSMSKIQDLQKSLSENIDVFLKNIEEIKKLEAEKTKPNKEVLDLCDEIIAKATELKSLSAAGVEGGDPEKKGKKEQLNIEIMNLVKKMVPMLYSSTPCLNQPRRGYCGQTSTMMLICTYNPLCGIRANSSIADYARRGSRSSSSSLLGLIYRNLPGRKIVQVNETIGISNPNYEPLFEQAKKGNPVVIGTMFPPNASYMHYVTVTGYAGEKNGVRMYRVNNPYTDGCKTIELPETYFKNNPYPGPDYWYMYVE